MKELKVLVAVESSDAANKIYNDPGTLQVKLESMFCSSVETYSMWCRNIAHLGIPKTSMVAEFKFFVQGGEEDVKTYLQSLDLNVLEIWS